MKIILWPFMLIFNLLSGIISLTGRFIGITLGLVLMILGLAATITIIGGIVGIPLMIFGFLLLLRSIF